MTYRLSIERRLHISINTLSLLRYVHTIQNHLHGCIQFSYEDERLQIECTLFGLPMPGWICYNLDWEFVTECGFATWSSTAVDIWPIGSTGLTQFELILYFQMDWWYFLNYPSLTLQLPIPKFNSDEFDHIVPHIFRYMHLSPQMICFVRIGLHEFTKFCFHWTSIKLFKDSKLMILYLRFPFSLHKTCQWCSN